MVIIEVVKTSIRNNQQTKRNGAIKTIFSKASLLELQTLCGIKQQDLIEAIPRVCTHCVDLAKICERWHSMTSLNTRRHALGHTQGVVHPLKGKGGSYPLGVVPPLWLKASSYRSLSGKVHGQLERELEGALDVHASSPTDMRVLILKGH